MKKKLRLIAAIGAMTCGGLLLSLASYAQVKIGSNPTTIDANNNLEIEASTSGRKVSVNRTTGKLTVKDGSEGAGKILTSDAAGNAEWDDIPPQQQKMEFAFRARNDSATDVEAGTGNYVYKGYNGSSEAGSFNVGGRFDFTNGIFTAPKKGFYLFNAGVRVEVKTGTSPGSHHVTASITKRNADGSPSDYRGIVGETQLVNGKYSHNLSTLYLLEPNDQVFIEFTKVDDGRIYEITSGFFEGMAIGTL